MKSKYKPRLDSQTSTVYFPLYTDAVLIFLSLSLINILSVDV